MENKGIYIVAKIFRGKGCLAYRCKTKEEIQSFPEQLRGMRSKGVQLIILNSPEIYSEYAPYTYVEDREEFLTQIARLSRDVPVSTLLTHSRFAGGDSFPENKSSATER